MGVFTQANFIDLFFLILCLRIIYIAVSRGALREGFKLMGLLAGSLCAFHFYVLIAQRLSSKLTFLKEESLFFVSFFGILSSVVLIFVLLRLIATSLFKLNTISSGERWLLLLAGFFRAAFLISIILFLYYLSPAYSRQNQLGISYKAFKNFAPKVYSATFSVFKKINGNIKLNKEVGLYHETKRSLPPHSK